MSSGIASLHKILKDETRRKIVLLLNERGNLSYTELLDTLGICSTGLLNYHLKVLGSLLMKSGDGRYALTEKGRLASRLLLEFPDDQLQVKVKWQRRFWIVGGVFHVIFLVSVLVLHFLGYMDFARTVLYVIAAASSIALSYFGYRMQLSRPGLGSKEEKSRMKVGYVLGGAWVGLVIGFFAPILLILLCRFLGGPDIARMEGGGELWILMLVIGSIVGGIAGYQFGKRRGFQKPKWAVWLDEHLG
jgi:hypothetical protein